jgi:hypothetical protein
MRQEFGMPQEDYPFYRYIPTALAAVQGYLDENKQAFLALQKQYTDAEFKEFENPSDSRPRFSSSSSSSSSFNINAQTRKIVKVYGAKTRKILKAKAKSKDEK